MKKLSRDGFGEPLGIFEVECIVRLAELTCISKHNRANINVGAVVWLSDRISAV